MLDINTPKGRIAAQQQTEALRIISHHCGTNFITTSDTNAACVDAFAVNLEGTIEAVAEIKSRDMTRRQLELYGDEWLVSFDKINHGAELSKMLRVPFIGILYLVPDSLVLTIVIANRRGDIVAPMRISRTETKKSINGGLIKRTNAYINMGSANCYKEQEHETQN